MAQPYEPVADAELTPDSDSLMRRENVCFLRELLAKADILQDENQRTALEETDSLLTVVRFNSKRPEFC